MPCIGKRGYFIQHFFPHVSIVGGVGGGSLVWAAVMLEPKPEFYADEQLANHGVGLVCCRYSLPIAKRSPISGMRKLLDMPSRIVTSDSFSGNA